MKYYNTKGEIIDIVFGVSKNRGISSAIYQLKDELYLKQYFQYTSHRSRMDYTIFKILNEIHSPFTNRVLELYYEVENVSDKKKWIDNLNHFSPDAYKFIYLPEKPTDILLESIDYFLYNLQNLEDLMDVFAEYKVMVRDLKRENTIFFGDKIVLIDLDSCRVSESEYKEIRIWNRNQFLNLFVDLCMHCKSYSSHYGKEINQLFTFNEDSLCITNDVSKQLVKYKRVIDYIKR